MSNGDEIYERYFELSHEVQRAERLFEAFCNNSPAFSCLSDEDRAAKKDESYNRLQEIQQEFGDFIDSYRLRRDRSGKLYDGDGNFLGQL